ncbi:MAG: hypothetical protein RBR54_11290 [Sulfurimonas sp.]|jgi:hypothetical protein|nr:hypothetical protein [Helicobacteraceae bacterium]MDY0122514.1 hypothetical protein [Sulfurimonas sp.]
MIKVLLTGCVVLLLSGCSYFTINATMCDEIASDPHANVPKECRKYSEEDAQKAFDKADKKQSSEEILKFDIQEKE